MGAHIHDNQFAELPNGMRLHYASAGEKGRPLILFVHGFPEFWYEWEAQLSAFGNDWFAVAPDLRGFNKSDMPLELAQYKAKHIVEDLRLLAAHLGYDRFVMVAHDWGGAIAWNFAIALPQLLHKLVIVNSPHPYLFAQALANDREQQAASEYMNWLRADGSESALAKDDFKLLEGLLNGMGQSPTPWFTAEVRARYHECWARGLTGGVNYYRASPLYPATPPEQVPELRARDFTVRVPTLVIWGEADSALLPQLLDGLDECVPDLRIERIAEGSHWVIHEFPDRISSLIRNFVGKP